MTDHPEPFDARARATEVVNQVDLAQGAVWTDGQFSVVARTVAKELQAAYDAGQRSQEGHTLAERGRGWEEGRREGLREAARLCRTQAPSDSCDCVACQAYREVADRLDALASQEPDR